MVIIRLQGGLANQMFEYAMARTVAHRRGTCVGLDFQNLSADLKRCYSLDAWNVNVTRASNLDHVRLQFARKWRRILKRSGPYYSEPYVCEQSFCFDPDALKAPGHCSLTGYWQSPKYFEEIEPIIRQEFKLRREPSAETQRTAEAIRASYSVFLHVRRGDYVAEVQTNEVHGVCSLEYYQNAAEYIARAVHQPHFFVFSDEPQWVRENLKLPFTTTVVDHNPPGDSETSGREHEDMWLMTLCRHAILANSSFSWWGAWLNEEGNRIVIRPKQWALDARFEPQDLLPGSWITM
jgi:Glycosyl transferase family 11